MTLRRISKLRWRIMCANSSLKLWISETWVHASCLRRVLVHLNLFDPLVVVDLWWKKSCGCLDAATVIYCVCWRYLCINLFLNGVRWFRILSLQQVLRRHLLRLQPNRDFVFLLSLETRSNQLVMFYINHWLRHWSPCKRQLSWRYYLFW